MYLDKIIEAKKLEVEALKKNIVISDLQTYDVYQRVCYSLKRSLQSSKTGIISEFKRKSPSKGFIKEGAEVADIVPGYEKSGATGISVLADEQFFAGGAKDVRVARELVNIPLLFKEFVIDEIQIHLAKSSGADVILLIAACLTKERMIELATCAKKLGLETLLEIHSEEELEYIDPIIDIVGINNRNLKTFEVDLAASIALCHKIPDSYVKISESGLSDPETVKMLRNEGFSGFLMGENFMKQADPAAGLKDFISKL